MANCGTNLHHINLVSFVSVTTYFRQGMSYKEVVVYSLMNASNSGSTRD